MEKVKEIKKGWGMKRLIYRLSFIIFGICAFHNPLKPFSVYTIAFGAVFGLIIGFFFRLFLKMFLNLFNRGLRKEMGKIPVKYAVDTGMLFLMPFAVMLLIATYILHWSQTMGFITTGIMAVGTAASIEMGRIKGESQIRNTIATMAVCFLFSSLWTLSQGYLTMIPAYIEGGVQLVKSLLT